MAITKIKAYLTKEDESLEESVAFLDPAHSRSKSRTRWAPERHHLHLSLLYTIICALLLHSVWTWKQNCDPSLALYSPANSVVEYEEVVFKKGFADELGPYVGPPTDEMDQLWDDLYQYGVMLHIPKSEADQLVDKTVPIWNMPGQYLTGLDIFHQLHCVNTFRKFAYPERYGMSVFFPNGTRDEEETIHYGHCIEHIREAVMCHGDTGTLQYVWSEEAQLVLGEMRSRHQCRKFDKIQKWAFDRWAGIVNRSHDPYNPY